MEIAPRRALGAGQALRPVPLSPQSRGSVSLPPPQMAGPRRSGCVGRAAALCLAALALLGLTGAGHAEIVRLHVLATTDIHGYMEDTPRLPEGGGWLRLATLIEKRRQAYGPEHALLIDCGDTTEGSFLAMVSQGQASIDLLQQLRYDAWVPGNHEFDFGIARFREFLRQTQATALCANLTLPAEGGVEAPPSWRMLTRAGLRVAVIGCTASYLDQWLWGKAVAGYRVEPALRALERVLPRVHAAQPDVIILAIHQGWVAEDPRNVNEVNVIAQRFPEIDLVLGGHTHQEFAGRNINSRTWYVQAGSNASHLADVTISFDRTKKAVVDIRSELIQAGPEVPCDAAARTVLKPWLEAATRTGAEPCGELAAPITGAGTPGESCGTSEVICRALAEASGAAVVFHGKFTNADLPAGRVSARKLFTIIPYENSIGVAWLTPTELSAVIEEQLPQRDTPAYNGVWGIRAQTDADGHVRQLMWPDGRPLAADTRIKTAFNSYVMAGGGGRCPRLREILRSPQAQAADTGIGTRDALRRYLEARPGLRLEPKRWLERASRPVAPAAAKPPAGRP